MQRGLKRGLPISSLSPEQLHVHEEAPARCVPGFTPLEVVVGREEGDRNPVLFSLIDNPETRCSQWFWRLREPQQGSKKCCCLWPLHKATTLGNPRFSRLQTHQNCGAVKVPAFGPSISWIRFQNRNRFPVVGCRDTFSTHCSQP